MCSFWSYEHLFLCQSLFKNKIGLIQNVVCFFSSKCWFYTRLDIWTYILLLHWNVLKTINMNWHLRYGFQNIPECHTNCILSLLRYCHHGRTLSLDKNIQLLSGMYADLLQTIQKNRRAILCHCNHVQPKKSFQSPLTYCFNTLQICSPP